MTDLAQQVAAHRAWQEQRAAELGAPDSWLGLVGLHWLNPGENPLGGTAENAVPLPLAADTAAPLGVLDWQADGVVWRPAPGSPVTVSGPAPHLATDREGAPSRLQVGSLEGFLIEREGRLALRVRDRDWASRTPFSGVACFPHDPAWCITARWETLPEALSLEVPSVTGELKSVVVQERAMFDVEGTEYALLPLDSDENGVFFVFRDRCSGKETYGGGRFLRTTPPSDGRVTLDFNRAYNPPCAFTPFATCPLPPPENWLPFPVRAGELKATK